MERKLNLANLPDNLQDIKKEELLLEKGKDVKVVLSLPDGTEDVQQFTMGTLVSYIKAFVQEKHSYSMAKQVLKLNDCCLIDTFCLADIPAINPTEVNIVTVLVWPLHRWLGLNIVS